MMDLELIFLNLKFAMADDGYTNIRVDRYNRNAYIVKAESLHKPASMFIGLVTDRMIYQLEREHSTLLPIFEYDYTTGQSCIDKEYTLSCELIINSKL